MYQQLSDRELAQKLTENARQTLALASQDKYRDKESLAKAARRALRALNLNPRLIEPYLILAHLALLTGQREQAADLLRQACNLAEGDPRPALLLKAVEELQREQPEPHSLTAFYGAIETIAFESLNPEVLRQRDQLLAPGLTLFMN